MLEIEARWVGESLSKLEAEKLSPILNIGSATLEFRQQVQPWIDRWIFAPLRQRGVEVHHHDVQAGAGIDIRGDLSDKDFVSSLLERRYRTVLCCNLLEHVVDPSAVCAIIERLLEEQGYSVVTVPHDFPYHPDPIDTMFRPEPNELAAMFPSCRLLDGAIIDCGTGWDYVEHNPWKLIRRLIRRLSGLREHGGPKGTTSFIPYLFRRFQQTCTVLQKAQTSPLVDKPSGLPLAPSNHPSIPKNIG
ncbi:MAG TPA: hypothetical protein VGW37_15255 [Terriglobia bacterium]|nr:hypothetical protein [Terriglobia bacterium]